MWRRPIQDLYPWVKQSSCLNKTILLFYFIIYLFLKQSQAHFYSSFFAAPATLCVLWFLFFSQLYQFLVHWSKVASSFCCRLNRLVLDDRSKILTTSGEKHDAQPGRERRRPDRSTGLHRGDAPLDKGRTMPHSAGRSGKDFSLYLILMSMFVCRYAARTGWDKTVWRL